MASRARLVDVDELLTTRQAAAYVGYSARHMQRLRARRSGPRWVSLDQSIAYLRDDLDDWLVSRHG